MGRTGSRGEARASANCYTSLGLEPTDYLCRLRALQPEPTRCWARVACIFQCGPDSQVTRKLHASRTHTHIIMLSNISCQRMISIISKRILAGKLIASSTKHSHRMSHRI